MKLHRSGRPHGLPQKFRETDFRYDEWLQALRDLGVEGMVVCESPNLEADAVMLKRLYRAQGARSV